ncbi:MAG: hypothetical protein HY704_11145 [Gemmatimonadetes bacterium]|nr:hypothetical protein [Gemmatimonadota bacterium]
MTSKQNPFAGSPFGDTPQIEPAHRIRAAVVKIRSLRSQIGHDGLTPTASRTLIDELTVALEACADALSAKQG